MYIYIYGPRSDKTELNDITTLRHNIGFYINVINARLFNGKTHVFICGYILGV